MVTHSAITYFTNQRPIIGTYLQGATDLNDRLDHLLRNGKARSMRSEINTKRKYPQSDTGVSEQTQYAAFVYQTQQDIRKGLDYATDSEESFLESNRSSLTKGKKKLVKVLDPLEENISRLKEANISYTKTQFEDLLKSRFKEGMSKKEKHRELSPGQRLREAIAEVGSLVDLGLLSENSEPFVSPKGEEGAPPPRHPMLSHTFVTHLLSAMNKKPKALSTFLSHANEAFIKNMKTSWSASKSPEEVNQSVSNLAKAFNPNTFWTFEMFLDRTQEFIENITQVYPSIIVNFKKINLEKINFPQSWDVSSSSVEGNHLRDIMANKYEALRPLSGQDGLDEILEKMKKQSRTLCFLVQKLRQYYRVQQQQQQPPRPSHPSPPVLLNADAMCLLFKFFIYTIYDQYHLLGEAVIDVAVVDQMMEIFLQLFLEDKELLNQERKPFAEVIISRKQRAQQKQQEYTDSLSSDEREVQRVLRRYGLGVFHSPSNDSSAELVFDEEEDHTPVRFIPQACYDGATEPDNDPEELYDDPATTTTDE
jgi:hypothetical protein